MRVSRRGVLTAVGLSAALAGAAPGSGERAVPLSRDGWGGVRAQFRLAGDLIDMSAMLLATHPRPVREAIARYRAELDRDPTGFLFDNNHRLTEAARGAAGDYLGLAARHIALVDSTTMGVGLIYAGLRLGPGDEILTTEQDYFVTHEAIRLACIRTGAVERRVSLHGDSAASVRGGDIVRSIVAGVTPRTRAVGLTWVHSSTGLKLPLRAIADALAEINRERDEAERILLCVDGVHGYGNQDATFDALGCDFLAAGCHKWLFGPRGTGMVAGREAAWRRLDTQVPSFLDQEVFDAWVMRRPPRGRAEGARFSPGGFKAFEHLWALPEAFALHDALGKPAVAARTQALATRFKRGLMRTPGVVLATPMAPGLSAGIVSFEIEGQAPATVVARLRERRVMASAAPYAKSWVRLTPSIRNSEAEVDAVLAHVRAIAARTA